MTIFTVFNYLKIYLIFVFDVDAVEESPSLRMFGEEDVEDKLDEKVMLENENPASLVEEIKLAVIEEDEKQPVESNPDQSQVKSSEGVSENAKEVVNILVPQLFCLSWLITLFVGSKFSREKWKFSTTEPR